MTETAARPDKGTVTIDAEECKGCGLCVDACVPRVLHLAAHLNRYGYHPATYSGRGCTGCGLCFFACPEPGAIRVYRRAREGAEFRHEAVNPTAPCDRGSVTACKSDSRNRAMTEGSGLDEVALAQGVAA